MPSATRAVAMKSRVGWSICTSRQSRMNSLVRRLIVRQPPRPVQPCRASRCAWPSCQRGGQQDLLVVAVAGGVGRAVDVGQRFRDG